MEKIKILQSKKSIFFSMVSVFIVTIFYLSLSISNQFKAQKSQMEVTRSRVEVLNSIINDMDDRYFERMLYVSGKSALGSMSYYAAKNPPTPCPADYWRYCSSSPEFRGYGQIDESLLIKELNSTMQKKALTNGADLSGAGFHLNDYNMQSLIDELEEAFERIGIKIESFEMDITSIEQVDAWNLRVGADISYYFKDANGIASWKGDTHKEAVIDIIGMWDPKHGTKIGSGYVFDTHTNSPSCSDYIGEDYYQNGCISGCDCIYEPSFLRKLRGETIPSGKDVGFGICPSTSDCNTPAT